MAALLSHPTPSKAKVNLFSCIWYAAICGVPIQIAVWGFFYHELLFWLFTLLSTALVILFFLSWRHWRKLKLERTQDSICTFTRLLPAKQHDTWVVRAVYENISQERGVSIRPTDRLEKDLGYDPDDLDDIIREIAVRATRDLSSTEANPLYGKVVTVADLIRFLEHQPARSQCASSNVS